jgi:hypothetical protein
MKRCLAVVAIAATAFGCGGSGPNLVSVTGTVTLDGKPLEGAVVTFHPDPSNKEGRPAEDITGASGNYKANTGGRSGLVPGKYHVVVTKAPQTNTAVNEAFKEDPFMAQLSSTGPEVGRDAQKRKDAKDKIEGEFDREIPPEGGPQDFDVKANSPSK